MASLPTIGPSGYVCVCCKLAGLVYLLHSTQRAFLEPLSIMDNDLTINFSVPAVPPKQTLNFLGFVLLVALSISLSVRCQRE